MKILIETSKDAVTYNVTGQKESTNDELMRAVAFLELVKAELIEAIDRGMGFEVFEKDGR